MKHEYHEGPEAKENFERLAQAVFAATPKHGKGQKLKKKATARKTSGKNKG